MRASACNAAAAALPASPRRLGPLLASLSLSSSRTAITSPSLLLSLPSTRESESVRVLFSVRADRAAASEGASKRARAEADRQGRRRRKRTQVIFQATGGSGSLAISPSLSLVITGERIRERERERVRERVCSRKRAGDARWIQGREREVESERKEATGRERKSNSESVQPLASASREEEYLDCRQRLLRPLHQQQRPGFRAREAVSHRLSSFCCIWKHQQRR